MQILTGPLFSIITVAYNAELLLPATIESVLGQTYPNIEYIIVDGASKDSSPQIIAQYAQKVSFIRWVSEKDNGLYDAMNKGLRMASGDFVWFLNAGDLLYSTDTLASLANLVGPETDVLYGETMLVDELGVEQGLMSALSTRKVPQQLNWRQYLGGMLVVHQSFVPRRSICPEYMENNLVADYDWCIQILKKSRENKNAGFVLSRYLMGGMSKQRHRQSLHDRFNVMCRHYGVVAAVGAHVRILFRAIFHKINRIGKTQY